MRDRGYAEDLMARARAVGSPVLVLTIDLAVVGARHRDTRNGIDGAGRALAQAAARARPRLASRAGCGRSALGGKPLTFGNLEKAVPDAQHPGRVQGPGSTRSSTPA